MTPTNIGPETADRDYLPCVYCDQYRSQITRAQHQEEPELEAVLHDVLHLHCEEKHAGVRRLHTAPVSR
ncbi:hypothetical protein [Streptomyces qinglanensis]|uniref:Uncharacterized protein n=1 Tax=Streptomyces qinglanensis TaxID=943816 RepID=A0A1H9NVH5_9ACTN|nr:hypothetical protein [Streptomyces qinglanensis]SER39353.1 hypothetical protein SAMN05421870_101661 [Streptomyces qinglanensis]